MFMHVLNALQSYLHHVISASFLTYCFLANCPVPSMKFFFCFVLSCFIKSQFCTGGDPYKSGLLHLLQLSLNLSVFLQSHNFVTLCLQILTVRNFIEIILYRFLPLTFYPLRCLNLFFSFHSSLTLHPIPTAVSPSPQPA